VTARRTRLLFTVLTALAGVVVAHTADYLAVLPRGGERARYLAATGHSYWPEALLLATVAGAAVIVLAARRGWRATFGVAVDRSWAPSFPVLCIGQVIIFTGMEVLERVGAGVSPAALPRSRTFLLGLLLQVAVAAIAVLVLRATHRAAAGLATVRRSQPRPASRSTPVLVHDARLRRTAAHGVGGARAPPLPV